MLFGKFKIHIASFCAANLRKCPIVSIYIKFIF
jgi:hypothetical protein